MAKGGTEMEQVNKYICLKYFEDRAISNSCKTSKKMGTGPREGPVLQQSWQAMRAAAVATIH